MLGDAGDHRHQVRLTGAVVANDKQPFVISWLIKLQIRDDNLGQPFRHLFGDDIRTNELFSA